MSAPTYEIRDPIHRTIIIDEAERLVVDHPWVQRLRHIRQLGFVSLVYPGAVHDRFQHSLGVMHLAGERFRRLTADGALGLSADDLAYGYRLARLCGLLHDVGHAPFSHTAEAHFPHVSVVRLAEGWYRDGQVPGDRQATHEDFSLAVVAGLAAAGVIEETVARDICAVLSSSIRRSARLAAMPPLVGVLRALVSGEIDSDRCDYLLRDSHFAGVTYGIYDLQRLMACERIVHGDDGPELGLDVHGVHALEGLLMARYHLFHQVYFHKTPPAFEYYLAQAIAEREVDLPLANGLSDLVELRDDHLVSRLHVARAAGGRWSRRILDREPAKLVLRERLGVEQQENLLSDLLYDALRDAGCHVFRRHSRQVFTKLASAANPDGITLQCERRVLGRTVVEQATNHSALLSAFNAPIDLRHTYVLREDAERAARVMDAIHAW